MESAQNRMETTGQGVHQPMSAPTPYAMREPTLESHSTTEAATTGAWPGEEDALLHVREELRAAGQQIEGAVAVLRERGSLNMDAAEAFARARSLCHRAERRLRKASGVLMPRAATPTDARVDS